MGRACDVWQQVLRKGLLHLCVCVCVVYILIGKPLTHPYVASVALCWIPESVCACQRMQGRAEVFRDQRWIRWSEGLHGLCCGPNALFA